MAGPYEWKLQKIASSGATDTGGDLNVYKEVVTRRCVSLYADHLIIYQALYSCSLVHYTFTGLPIYIEQGYPWKFLGCFSSICEPHLIAVTTSQYLIKILKYVDMCDFCDASALPKNFGERSCTANARESGWWRWWLCPEVDCDLSLCKEAGFYRLVSDGRVLRVIGGARGWGGRGGSEGKKDRQQKCYYEVGSHFLLRVNGLDLSNI